MDSSGECPVRNADVAKLLREIADLLELQEDTFRPRAYRRASRSIEQLTEELSEIAARGELQQIPGVGKAIAEKIQEVLQTGRIQHLEKLRSKVDPGLVELLKIPEVGPKTVRILHETLGITTFDDLRKALEEHRVQELPGFGPRSEEKLAQNLGLATQYQERMFIGHALLIAERLIAALGDHPDVEKISVAGSLRRWQETIGDIDILASSQKPRAVMKSFVHLEDVDRILAEGPTKSSVVLHDGIQVDLRVMTPESFGAALLYFTGSKAHNIALRSIARKRGWKLNEYGLVEKKTQDVIASRTEEAIYQALGMSWIPPEIREDAGEIQLAMQNQLPKLIQFDDLRGDLHVHTEWSDGSDTIEAMVEAAIERSYEYLAISDHSKFVTVAKGMDESRLREQISRIREIDDQFPEIRILAGVEVDILSDGQLDLSNEVLAESDIVTASIHQPKGSPNVMTQRIIRACQNEHVDILGHPTGRIVNRRPPYDLDMEAILKTAKSNSVSLEINSTQRLDLSADLIRQAKEHQLTFAINSDAHKAENLNILRFGVGTARRGGLESPDVLNTQPFNQLKRILKHVH